MTYDDSTRVRVIRAIIGMDSKSFAARMGIGPATLTSWEKGRATPNAAKRQELYELCQEHGIGFSPSGMPFPWAEMFNPKPGEFTGWDSSSPPNTQCVSGNSNHPPSPRQGKSLGRPSGSKNRSRRDELLRRFKVDVQFLNSQPQIAPLLKQYGILPTRVIEVLRADDSPESKKLVALWDSLTPANQKAIGLEALSVAAGLTSRRLWELYSGANLMQGLAKAGRGAHGAI